MKVTVAPAGTRTATATIRSLLQLHSPDRPVEVRAVYRDLGKAPEEFATYTNFFPGKGDIEHGDSLDFSGSDAVLTLTPPVYDGRDLVDQAEKVSRNVRDAVERAGCVKRLVLLSSMGAQYSEGVGEIKTNNAAERVLSPTKVPEVVIARCAYFMENWSMTVDSLRGDEPFIVSTITPLDWKVPMVAVKDIGDTLAGELTADKGRGTSPYTFELRGPKLYSPRDVQAGFSKAIGREVGLKAIEKHELDGFYGKIFPPQIVGDWVEMAMCFLPGGIAAEDFSSDEHGDGDDDDDDDGAGIEIVRGPTDLSEVLKGLVEAAGI